MARPSARPRLLEAALTVVEERGITALTLDAVAEEAGVTKRGLIYHFPSKHALILGLHEELASRLEVLLIKETGKDPEVASLLERTRGYVKATLTEPGNVELQLILDATNEPEWLAPWNRIYHRWFPEEELPVEELDDVSVRCLVARMAADGYWGYETIVTTPISREARARIVGTILKSLDGE